MTTIVDGNYFHFLKIVAIRTIALYEKIWYSTYVFHKKGQTMFISGGVPAEDLCYMHLTGSDECDPSISGSDQGGCKSDSDECSFFGLADACTWGLNKDIAE